MKISLGAAERGFLRYFAILLRILPLSVLTLHVPSPVSNGSIHFENCDAASLSLDSMSGSVVGTLNTGKAFRAQSRSGKVDVPLAVPISITSADTVCVRSTPPLAVLICSAAHSAFSRLTLPLAVPISSASPL